MKMDKDFLMKHRFWLLLGAFVPIWGLTVLMLLSDVGGKSEKQKAYEDALKSVNFSSPKNASFLEPLKKQEETFRKQKDKVWERSWKNQDGLMTWADAPQAPFGRRLKNAYFGDELSDYQERVFYARNLYLKQFEEFDDKLAPAEYKDGVERVITRIYDWKDPKSMELWLAQEDFWVKREVVDAIREALHSVARFTVLPLDPKNPKDAVPQGALARYRLRNPNWELDLIVEQRGKSKVISDKSKIRNVNVNQRLQKLDGVVFRLTQKGEGGAPLDIIDWAIEGEPLAYYGEAEVRKTAVIDAFDPQKPPEVEQLFNWYTSPIKRLDRLEVGNRMAVAHRMESRELIAKQLGKPEPEAEPAAPPAGGMDPMGMGGGLGGPKFTPPGVGGEGPGGQGRYTSPTMTPNGLEPNRYIDLSDQVRRIPVALVLVADQAFIPDILTALANSRLRMWTTQVLWQHVQGIRPQNQQAAFTAGGFPPPGGGPGGEGGEFGPGPGGRPFGPGGRPIGPGGRPFGPPPGVIPMGPMGPMGPGASGGLPDEDDPNLVELTVYNIASLYERFPPRQAAGEGTETPMPMTDPTMSPNP